MPKLLRAFVIGSLAGAVGCGLGILAGYVLAIVGKELGVPYWFLATLNMGGIGAFLFWFLLPIENKHFWLKIVSRSRYEYLKYDWRDLHQFAPTTFFLIVGMAIGLHRGY